MRFLSTVWKVSVLVVAAFAGGLVGSMILHPAAPAASNLQGEPIIETFGVGGVLTAQGELWQYRPDKKRWVTLDESFALEGQATSIVPLPVPPEQIQHMETFGFLVARSGDCWLYDLEERIWKNIAGPPAGGGR